MELPSYLIKLKDYFVDKPKPILGVETIQIVVIREVQDYTVLRTEETRELNTVTTPLSYQKMGETTQRVVFLGSKQKATETRYFRSLLNTAAENEKLKLEECYLKDNMCLNCPRCILYGGVQTKGNAPNIKHRINYSTAYSLLPFEAINTTITFNAVDEATQKTGQALGTIYAVKPASVFISSISLRSVTWKEFVLQMKTLLATKDYGAETRVRGSVRNIPIAVIAGWEEVITPLELTLHLFDKFETEKTISSKQLTDILQEYIKMAGFQDKIMTIIDDKLDKLIADISEQTVTKEFLKETIKDAEDFRKEQKDKDKS